MRRPPRFHAPPNWPWFSALALLVAWPLATLSLAVADEPRPVSPAPAGTSEQSGDEAEADAPTPRRAGPVVRSADEAARSRSASSFLRSGGDDPYGDPIDWRSIPAWQQTSFYGIRARGSFFVFVVDCSGSMDDDLRLDRAKQELRRCISSLRYPQRYLIVFFNQRSIPMGGGIPRSADLKGKQATFSWLNSIAAEGGTDPRASMNLALGLRPDAVFLLSDGEFPSGSEATILRRNADGIPIHCIDLGSGLGAAQLRAIAEGSGGRYVSRR